MHLGGQLAVQLTMTGLYSNEKSPHENNAQLLFSWGLFLKHQLATFIHVCKLE